MMRMFGQHYKTVVTMPIELHIKSTRRPALQNGLLNAKNPLDDLEKNSHPDNNKEFTIRK
jgi:hypothetical protein